MAEALGGRRRNAQPRRRPEFPDRPAAVLGDFNIAPEDRDVYDPAAFVGSTHTTPFSAPAGSGFAKAGLFALILSSSLRSDFARASDQPVPTGKPSDKAE